jgi:geranylgeranyl diphosphate synthase type I
LRASRRRAITIDPTATAGDPGGSARPEPPALAALRARIDVALGRALDRALPRIEASHPSVAEVTAELRSFTDGGKRIRPALLLLGFEAAGGDGPTTVEGPALALELLHTCALVHDDVIDQAATRRGRASVHHAAAERHRAAGWSGDADAYGRAVAILIGDLAFVLADELFLAAEVPDQELLAAFRWFTTLREEVMVGQYLDLQAATARLTERALAIEIATLKSGRYSVARPLEIGARLAGAGEELVTGLRAFGDPLGRAFQLADDLLGVFGDAEETGKSTSSDLAEGKRTLLIAEAVERLDGAELARLEEALGRDDLDAATTAELRELLIACGARDAILAQISAYIDEARAALDGLSLPAGSRTSLSAVADYLGERSR